MVSLLLQSGTVRPVSVVFAVVTLATVWSSVERVLPHEKRALTVFGEYRKLLEPGFTLIPPFVSGTHAIDMRTQTLDVPRQESITQDNLPVSAKITVDVSVIDAETAFLEVDDHKQSVIDKSEHTLRITIGDHKSSVALHNHASIGHQVRQKLNETTAEWGVRVEKVEIQDVSPPKGYDG